MNCSPRLALEFIKTLGGPATAPEEKAASVDEVAPEIPPPPTDPVDTDVKMDSTNDNEKADAAEDK